MKILTALFLAGMIARGDTMTVSVKGPKNQVSSSITVNPAATITNINCTPGTVIEGDMVSCVLIIDRPAPTPNGLKLSVFGVPGTDSIVVPPGATSVIFSFQAAIPPQVPPAKPAAQFHPLPMPMHNGPALGLATGLFLAMHWYSTEQP